MSGMTGPVDLRSGGSVDFVRKVRGWSGIYTVHITIKWVLDTRTAPEYAKYDAAYTSV
ncbi:MAG TPA: hypothetical protein VGS11_05580 [Candidatus Bathyarchaeia archaeon]|nr:hypothetical protein [Candidatus Bathyarchaeia archaeon]